MPMVRGKRFCRFALANSHTSVILLPMKIPAFSRWLHWDNRLLSEHRTAPGVYFLARFEEGPPDVVDPCDKRLILIGETHGQTLQTRWDQFQYSAFKGGENHAGGYTFHRLFSNGTDSATPHWLFVAAAPVPEDVSDVKGYVQSVKNDLLAAYQNRYGLLPCCNLRGPVEVALPATVTTEVGATSVDMPAVVFSPWHPWAERFSIEGMDAAGVYTLACFEKGPPPNLDVLDGQVVYIGETCDNDLAGRLSQFHRSAFLGKYGHSGGTSFSTRCVGKGDQLHVSLFPVSKLHEPFRSAFIRHTERKFLWEYVRRWGRRPTCNSK